MAERSYSMKSELPPSYESIPPTPISPMDDRITSFSFSTASSEPSSSPVLRISNFETASSPASSRSWEPEYEHRPTTSSWEPDYNPDFPNGRRLNPHRSRLTLCNVKYGFRQVSMNAMVLTSESGPKYHISVSSNCFVPSAFITSIREGGSENGASIADFQMGIIRNTQVPEMVSIRGKQYSLTSIVKDMTKSWRRNESFKLEQWKFGNANFFWDISSQSGLKLCYASAEIPRTNGILLATFECGDGMSRTGSDYLATLEVTPDGQKADLLEHILVSVLIMERIRLTPSAEGIVKSATSPRPKLSEFWVTK
ncbi:hypothetical protein L218DRAFT_1082152 [Marasmius fiardii PR-910]|nr:hypothetical protein L218DRAFT_1082152 [Marasmius fiardii PR-910]